MLRKKRLPDILTKNIILIKYLFPVPLILLFLLVILPLFLTNLFDFSIEKALPFSKPSYLVSMPETVTIYRTSTNQIETIPFEKYITGVVAGEMPASFETEALKAQAVAARTYSLSKIKRYEQNGFSEQHPSACLCDSDHCQVYRSPSELISLKTQEWFDNSYSKIEKAVNSTKGEVMYYDSELVSQALFHSSCGGRTENSEDVFVSAVPYLRSVDSPFEEDATHKNETLVLSLTDFLDKISKSENCLFVMPITKQNIKILSHSEGGKVKEIQIGDKIFSGRDIRTALNLYSSNFNISFDNSNPNIIQINSTAFGHGVGMSQYGANGMAKQGYSYKEILTHYYTGVEIYKD